MIVIVAMAAAAAAYEAAGTFESELQVAVEVAAHFRLN